MLSSSKLLCPAKQQKYRMSHDVNSERYIHVVRSRNKHTLKNINSNSRNFHQSKESANFRILQTPFFSKTANTAVHTRGYRKRDTSRKLDTQLEISLMHRIPKIRLIFTSSKLLSSAKQQI